MEGWEFVTVREPRHEAYWRAQSTHLDINLLDGEGEAGLVEHIDASKVGLAAVGRLTDSS